MFQIGDKVFYPLHGAGVIQNVEEREILGENRKYYVLQFPLNNMTVMLPVNNVQKLGLRQIVDSNSLNQVEDILREQEDTLTDNWNQRFRENANLLKTGDIFSLAQVVRSLMVRNRQKGLSTGEKKMLEDAKQYLISEIVLVREIEQEQAYQFLEQTISIGV